MLKLHLKQLSCSWLFLFYTVNYLFHHYFQIVPETLYLEDDFTRIARFPCDITGAFDATFWQDKLTLQVMGESPNVPGLCNEALIPSPQQFGIGRSTATATQVKAHTSVSSKLSSFQGKRKKQGITEL